MKTHLPRSYLHYLVHNTTRKLQKQKSTHYQWPSITFDRSCFSSVRGNTPPIREIWTTSTCLCRRSHFSVSFSLLHHCRLCWKRNVVAIKCCSLRLNSNGFTDSVFAQQMLGNSFIHTYIGIVAEAMYIRSLGASKQLLSCTCHLCTKAISHRIEYLKDHSRSVWRMNRPVSVPRCSSVHKDTAESWCVHLEIQKSNARHLALCASAKFGDGSVVERKA